MSDDLHERLEEIIWNGDLVPFLIAERIGEFIAEHYVPKAHLMACPIGMDSSPMFCSAGLCSNRVCMEGHEERACNAETALLAERDAYKELAEALDAHAAAAPPTCLSASYERVVAARARVAELAGAPVGAPTTNGTPEGAL